MADYFLLFRGGDSTTTENTPEKKQAYMQQWMDWMAFLNEQGKFAGAQPLKPNGKVISGTGKLVTDGPFVEGKAMVGGYLICKAASYEEAVEISKGCPVLIYESGIVEIREIQDIQM
jgi:hypothetical protein